MRISDISVKDKVEIIKQQKVELQKVLDSKIVPHENHTLFEVDLNVKEIRLAVFDELPAIKWEDAINKSISAIKKVTKKENCIYISALNKKNVIKILKRDYGIML